MRLNTIKSDASGLNTFQPDHGFFRLQNGPDYRECLLMKASLLRPK
jgi:hypothetical protein